MRRPWDVLGASWAPLGRCLGNTPLLILGTLGHQFDVGVRRSRETWIGYVKLLWCLFRSSGSLGASFGIILALLGRFWASFGVSWVALGNFLASFLVSWGSLGASWGAFLAQVGPS